MKLKKYVFIFTFLISLCLYLYGEENSNSVMYSKSHVDWANDCFYSDISFDIDKAGIAFPSGRSFADSSISTNLPQLVKDPLLTLRVDSSTLLGDLVVRDVISLEQITDIINSGKKTPSYFSRGISELKVKHSISIKDLSSLMIFHNSSYSPVTPIERVSSRKYTGIIIDARGLLNVHGEFSTDKAIPCFFPKIYDEKMDLLYERNMVDSQIARKNGIVTYASGEKELESINIAGHDPLRISARKIYGVYRTDPVISRKDALKILSIPENRELLKQGKVVILLDKENLNYDVLSPLKDENYYVKYHDVENFYYEKKIPDIHVVDGPTGMEINIENLNFMADSSELISGEEARLDAIAESLKEATKDGGFTILVEGHTASVGKPQGEMNLSIERARTIISQMVSRGVQQNLFSYRGFGGSAPVADNSTSEGRAKNRRVVINVVPQQTYIQRLE